MLSDLAFESVASDSTIAAAASGAPETNLKYQQARIKLLSQQLQEAVDIRRELTENISDLNRQLKNEKEESKGMKKRYR
jgi:hypothetical protein